jgi:hypothetical protein
LFGKSEDAQIIDLAVIPEDLGVLQGIQYGFASVVDVQSGPPAIAGHMQVELDLQAAGEIPTEMVFQGPGHDLGAIGSAFAGD